MGIEHLTVLFPTEVSSFDFRVECTDKTVQYKLNAQSLRLFGLHRDVNDAHRSGANRLQNKNKNSQSWSTCSAHDSSFSSQLLLFPFSLPLRLLFSLSFSLHILLSASYSYSLVALNLTHLHHCESCGLRASNAALSVSRSVSTFCASYCRTGHSHSSNA